MLRFVDRRYLTVDLRTLGLFRILFGLLLLWNLYDRTSSGRDRVFFTDQGVLPGYGILKAQVDPRTWSLLFAFTSLAEFRVALVFIVFVYVAYTVGWRTRVMKWLVVLVLLSLFNRNALLQNGGVVVVNLVAIWSAFLPLGARFSLDAFRHAPPKNQTVSSLAYGFYTLNFAAIYAFNAVQKTGKMWHEGSAIHYELWLNTFATNLAVWLRMHETPWLSPMLTSSTLMVERAIPVCILFPFGQALARRSAIWLVVGLHLCIALLMDIGVFPYIMICGSLLLLHPTDWEGAAEHYLGRLRDPLEKASAWLAAVFGPVESEVGELPARRALERAGGWVRDGASVVLAVCVATQILNQAPILPKWMTVKDRPAPVATVIEYLRIRQYWRLFAPDVPREDKTIVVDGELADHSHVDPLTGRPPDFDWGLHGALLTGEQWQDYFTGIRLDKNKAFLPYFGDYVLRAHTLPDAKISEPIERYKIYRVLYHSPPPGTFAPFKPEKKLLYSGERDAGAPPPGGANEKPAASAPWPDESESAPTEGGVPVARPDGGAQATPLPPPEPPTPEL